MKKGRTGRGITPGTQNQGGEKKKEKGGGKRREANMRGVDTQKARVSQGARWTRSKRKLQTFRRDEE